MGHSRPVSAGWCPHTLPFRVKHGEGGVILISAPPLTAEEEEPKEKKKEY